MEREWIAKLRRMAPLHPCLTLGIGDDAAILRSTPGMQSIAATDLLAEGVHFTANDGWERVGRKALAVNLSDFAAMAAKPTAMLVSLLLPRKGAEAIADGLYRGLLRLADEFDVALAGGDFNTWNGGVVINVTLLGEAKEGKAWRRSGAQPGDWLLSTGPLGGSLSGRHLDFIPRVCEAAWIAERYQVNAAMDLSDGLAIDLHRLLEESQLGGEILADNVPVHQEVYATLSLEETEWIGRSPLEHALSDGEDFELLLAMPAEEAKRLMADPHVPLPVFRLGQCSDEPGVWLINSEGRRVVLEPRGYEHGEEAD